MSLWWYSPAAPAEIESSTTVDLTVVTGEITLTGVVPALDLGSGIDLIVPTAEITLTGVVPALLIGNTIDLTMVTGQVTFTGVVPDLDLEGIVWVAATASAPTLLAAELFGFWLTDDIVVRLYGTGLSYSQDADRYADGLADELPTAGGYTAGGMLLTGKSLDTISATNRTRLLSDPVEWTGFTTSAAYAAVIRDTGSDATSPILGVYDFDGLRSPGGDVFHVEPGVDGWGIGVAA